MSSLFQPVTEVLTPVPRLPTAIPTLNVSLMGSGIPAVVREVTKEMDTTAQVRISTYSNAYGLSIPNLASDTSQNSFCIDLNKDWPKWMLLWCQVNILTPLLT